MKLTVEIRARGQWWTIKGHQDKDGNVSFWISLEGIRQTSYPPEVGLTALRIWRDWLECGAIII